MSENALTIGFARRAAPYKRSDLIFRNEEIIAPLLRDKNYNWFSGKAHPEDRMGKEIIKSLVEMDRKYRDSIVFLENYNMELAACWCRAATSGSTTHVDPWRPAAPRV